MQRVIEFWGAVQNNPAVIQMIAPAMNSRYKTINPATCTFKNIIATPTQLSGKENSAFLHLFSKSPLPGTWQRACCFHVLNKFPVNEQIEHS